jgi:acetyl esterase/lipase
VTVLHDVRSLNGNRHNAECGAIQDVDAVLFERSDMLRTLRSRVLLGFLIVLISAAGIFREEIVFNVRLMNVARQGNAYYADYPFLTKNIAYGTKPHQLLDVYRPDDNEQHPVVIYIHGGGWNSGNKELYALVAQKLVPLGMVVVVPAYQLYPDATYPSMVSDVAAAIAWTRSHIADYQGNPARIIVGGQSAGAQLSAMAFLDPATAPALAGSPSLCGYFGISGVYDIDEQYAFEVSHGRTAPVMTAVMGGPTNFESRSPGQQNLTGFPQTLIIHGDADDTVDIGMSERFVDALKTASVPVIFNSYPGRGHSELLFHALTESPGRLIADVTAFADACP